MNAPQTELEKYINHLRYHDWWFEYTEDHRVWRAGQDSYATLLEERRRLDPDWTIWNQHAPEEYRVKQPS
jgi:hypothetical protein